MRPAPTGKCADRDLTVSDFLIDTRLRFAKQISLREIAAQSLKSCQLLLRFNTFCNSFHIERFRHARDQFDDSQGVFLRRYRMHKGLVYFDFIEGQSAEARKRRVSGTKIIDGDFYPQGPELIKRIYRRSTQSLPVRGGQVEVQFLSEWLTRFLQRPCCLAGQGRH